MCLVVILEYGWMSENQPPLLAFVGGFLAAGKTTLILKAAALLRDRGQRVAVIMNDQDAGLVDTRLSLAQDFPTREVAGGCFCCRFSDLIDAAEQFADFRPQVILAEPVGSCVDLSATILQPLRAFHRDTYRLAPLSVLLDPAALAQCDRGEMHPDIEFLFRHQIAEADLVCLSKQDLHPATQPLSFPVDFHLSARTGMGVDAWLEEVLDTSRVVGAHLLEVDYGRYAVAEASLGWLNLHAALHLVAPASPALIVGPLLDRLEEQLTAQRIHIAHLKVFDRTSSGWIKASISTNGDEPVPEGDLLASAAYDHEVALNLRALADPALLRAITTQILEEFDGQLRISHLGAFRPARPVPEHRFASRAN